MQTSTLEFPHNARRTYTAVRHLFEMKRTQFSGVSFNDDLLIVEARHDEQQSRRKILYIK